MSIPFFPQLPVGSIAQYPISRQWSKTTQVNEMQSGATVLMPGTDPARVSWKLNYTGLSDAEWSSLATLFNSVHGSYGTFTFLDPTDNLLAWSGDFTQKIWSVDPLLQLTGGAADPENGNTAATIVNAGQAAQRIMQSILGAGWFLYCFSVYLRAATDCSVKLVRSTASGEATQGVNVSQTWTRFVVAGALTGQDANVSFGIEIPPAVAVAAFGPQAEAQPSPGLYKPTLSRGGVYTASRFDQDVLTQTADAVGQYSTTLVINSAY